MYATGTPLSPASALWAISIDRGVRPGFPFINLRESSIGRSELCRFFWKQNAFLPLLCIGVTYIRCFRLKFSCHEAPKANHYKVRSKWYPREEAIYLHPILYVGISVVPDVSIVR